MTNLKEVQRLKFWRSFMAISLLIIVVNSAFLAWLLSDFLEERMLERDVTVSMEFVNSIVQVKNATAYFHSETMNPTTPEMEEFFRHVASFPDVIRANVYGHDRSVLWSSDLTLVGKKFAGNDELEDAFLGKLEPEMKVVQRDKKEEHVNFPTHITQFVENYLPIWSAHSNNVVGVVEIYKHPTKLLDAISTGQTYVWMGSAGAALVLYLGLGLVVLYARGVLRAQEAQNVEVERLAVVGEMASAVAHGLRNPLAAIRSCAELALDDELPTDTRRAITDIVSQSDRLEGWIRSFLRRSRQESDGSGKVIQIDELIRTCLNGFSAQLDTLNIRASFRPIGDSPLVLAPSNELQQVFNSVLSNSIEAIKRDGDLIIARKRSDTSMVCVTIRDTGPGVPEELLTTVFTPFATNKPSGLGIGMALARRTAERIGGALEFRNGATGGAEVLIQIPAVRNT